MTRTPLVIAVAVVVVGSGVWVHLTKESSMSKTASAEWPKASTAQSTVASLQLVAVGVIAEKLRQADLWVMAKPSEGRKVVSDDPKLYETNADRKSHVSEQRELAALEWGLRAFVEGWAVPYMDFFRGDLPSDSMKSLSEMDILASSRPRAGLHWHRHVKVGSVFTSRTDVGLQEAFRFFDVNPDAPALLLFIASDGDHTEGARPPDAPTESIVVLLLARRDRIDWLRNFAKYASKGGGNYPEFFKWKSDPPVPFTPTQYIPKPWTPEQIAQFDALPTLAVIHRPVTVPYRKLPSGEPVHEAEKDSVAMTDDEKLAAFATTWEKAMSVLPRTLEGALHPRAVPARLFFDFGDASNSRAIVPVTRHLMHNADPQSMRLDVMDPKVGFNTFNILGDTRTASPMVQWAVGSIATWKEKDVSVTLDLRSPHGATITVITPDTSPQNLARKHPGGDPIDFSLR